MKNKLTVKKAYLSAKKFMKLNKSNKRTLLIPLMIGYKKPLVPALA
jgi:hypothetical protein